jgi:hypothetical protein
LLLVMDEAKRICMASFFAPREIERIAVSPTIRGTGQ